MRTFLRIGIASALVFAVTAALTNSVASAAGSPAEKAIGFFEDLQYDVNNPAKLDYAIQQIKDSGARYARFQMRWSNIQPNGPGDFNYAEPEFVVTKLLNAGIKPIAVVGTTPKWASRVPGCTEQNSFDPEGVASRCFPTDANQLRAFVSLLGNRFKGRVQNWEFWNEPNSNSFWLPYQDPRSYANLVNVMADALHGIDTTNRVATGGLALEPDADGPQQCPYGAGQPCYSAIKLNPRKFYSQMASASTSKNWDAVGMHPFTYDFAVLPGQVPPGCNPNGLDNSNCDGWTAMLQIRKQMESNGDGAKQIWVTEYGAPTNIVSPDRQAELYGWAIIRWKSYSWAGPFISYELSDHPERNLGPTIPASREAFFGVIDAQGVRKPAYDRLKSGAAYLAQ